MAHRKSQRTPCLGRQSPRPAGAWSPGPPWGSRCRRACLRGGQTGRARAWVLGRGTGVSQQEPAHPLRPEASHDGTSSQPCVLMLADHRPVLSAGQHCDPLPASHTLPCALPPCSAPPAVQPRLTKRDDVGHHALQLKGPEGAADAPKAALHLVRHAHRPRSAHFAVHPSQVSLRQEHLGDEQHRGTRAGQSVESAACGARTPKRATVSWRGYNLAQQQAAAQGCAAAAAQGSCDDECNCTSPLAACTGARPPYLAAAAQDGLREEGSQAAARSLSGGNGSTCRGGAIEVLPPVSVWAGHHVHVHRAAHAARAPAGIRRRSREPEKPSRRCRCVPSSSVCIRNSNGQPRLPIGNEYVHAHPNYTHACTPAHSTGSPEHNGSRCQGLT